MHEHNHTTHDPQQVGHETSDADVGALTKLGVGLAVLCVIVLGLMLMMLKSFDQEKTQSTPPPSPLAALRALPPGPRLQVLPEKDLVHLQAAEDSVLNNYGWVMREANIVRLPIDRALELTVQRGLPSRAGGRRSTIEDRRAKTEDRGLRSEDGGSQP